MSKADFNTTDRIMFGVFYGVVAIAAVTMGIAQLIEACRTRPKVQLMVLSLKNTAVKDSKPGPDESPSAAE